jgi:hypothetical protein
MRMAVVKGRRRGSRRALREMVEWMGCACQGQ